MCRKARLSRFLSCLSPWSRILDPLRLFLDRPFVAVVVPNRLNERISFGRGHRSPITVPEILDDQPPK